MTDIMVVRNHCKIFLQNTIQRCPYSNFCMKMQDVPCKANIDAGSRDFRA